jgi:hypothetical protein
VPRLGEHQHHGCGEELASGLGGGAATGDLVVQRWNGIARGEDPQLSVQVPGMPPTAQLADEIKSLLAQVLGGQ